jgi:hypothetical protein
MSVKRITAVWDLSLAEGNDRLIMLALADHADDDGFAWPGVERIAEKCRLSKRTVLRSIESLEALGELWVSRNRRRGNHYIVIPGLTDDEIKTVLCKKCNLGPSEAGEVAKHIRAVAKGAFQKCQNDTSEVSKSHFRSVKMTQQKCQNDTSEMTDCHFRSDTGDTSEVTPVSQEPSTTVRNHQRSDAKKTVHENGNGNVGDVVALSDSEAEIVRLYGSVCGIPNGFRYQEILSLWEQFPDINLWRRAFKAASENAKNYHGRWAYAQRIITGERVTEKPQTANRRWRLE